MRAFIKELNRELETVAPHISHGDPLRLNPRNPDCPHCDILAEYMMKDPQAYKALYEAYVEWAGID